MPYTRSLEPIVSTPGHPGQEAGFHASSERELERLVAPELAGVAEGPRLLSSAGPWVTFLAREPFYGAKVMVSVRSREGLHERTIAQVLDAAAGDRDVIHPAALSVRQFGSTGKLLWVGTPQQRGRLLSHWYGPGLARPKSAALDFIRQVAGPLQSLHGSGLVHGALSTSAFHRDVDGTVRVRGIGIDLPLVRADLHRGKDTEAVLCTAPEVRTGRPPTAASDQYAVAALLVRIVTGSAPSPDAELPERVPPEWRATLARALARDQERRFRSVHAMWVALDPEHGRTAPAIDFVDDVEDESDASREPAYVPSAFSPRARGRQRVQKGVHPAPAARAVLPDASWDEEIWDFDEAAPAVPATRGRAFAAFAMLLLFTGGLAWIYGTHPEILPLAQNERLSLDDGPSRSPRSTEDAPAPAPADEPRASLEPGTDRPDDAPAGGEPLGAMPDADRWGFDDPAATDDFAATRPPSSTAAASDSPAPTSGGDEPPAPDGRDQGPAASAADRAAQPAAGPAPGATTTPPLPVAAAPPVSSPASVPAGTDAPPDNLLAGSISMQSYPWGEVYLDGIHVGTTPILDLSVQPGLHIVRIQRQGYETHYSEVYVDPGDGVRLTGIMLRPRSQ